MGHTKFLISINGRQIAKEQPNAGGHTDILLLMLCEYCITTHITTNIYTYVGHKISWFGLNDKKCNTTCGNGR